MKVAAVVLSLVAVAVLSLVLSVIFTPLAMRVLAHLGMVDRPDGQRKLQSEAVPVAGGIVVWLAMIFACLIGNSMLETPSLHGDNVFWLTFLAATGVICLVGLVDDAWNLRGIHKLMGQMVACGIVVSGGLLIENIQFFNLNLSLGVLAIPFTLFWLLGAINAMNLVDGMDGMASTIGLMIGLALCVMSVMTGRVEESVVMAALVGALLGFLVFNLPPARVYLGDTGSMMIGLVLGVMAVRASLKGPTSIALVAPVTIWTLPILDALMAILRRRLTGRSILVPDRAHLHHRLRERGYSSAKALLLIASLTAITTTGAVFSIVWSREWIAPLVALAVVVFLVINRLFGHSELALLARHFHSMLRMVVPFRDTGGNGQEHRSRIQGTTEWDRLWESLLQYGRHCGFTSVQLSVNLPSLHEQFFARWELRESCQRHELYHVEVPLASAGLGPFGSLRVTGSLKDQSGFQWVAEVVEGLRPFELQIVELLNETALEVAILTKSPAKQLNSTAPRPHSMEDMYLLDQSPIRARAISAPVSPEVQ